MDLLPADLLTVAIDRSPELMTIALAGELDLQSTTTFTAALDGALHDLPATVAIDLRGVEFMDSSGLGAILLARTRIQALDARCVIVRGGAQVSRLLQVAGLEELLELVDDPEHAAG